MRGAARFMLVVAGVAAWVLWLRLPPTGTALWLALVWLTAFLCQAMCVWRSAWPRAVKSYMAFALVLLAFAVFEGLRLPHAAFLFHTAWIPAVLMAAAMAL